MSEVIHAIVDSKIQQLIAIIVKVAPNIGEQILHEYRRESYYKAKDAVQVEVSAFDVIVDPVMQTESSFHTGKGVLTPADVHFDYACEQDDDRFNFKHYGYVPDQQELKQVLEQKPYLFGIDDSNIDLSEEGTEKFCEQIDREIEELDKKREEWNRNYDKVMSGVIEKG